MGIIANLFGLKQTDYKKLLNLFYILLYYILFEWSIILLFIYILKKLFYIFFLIDYFNYFILLKICKIEGIITDKSTES